MEADRECQIAVESDGNSLPVNDFRTESSSDRSAPDDPSWIDVAGLDYDSPHEARKTKSTSARSRYHNLTNVFELAVRGAISQLTLDKEMIHEGQVQHESFREQQVLGQFTASALVANDMLGGMFYTLPSVVAVAGVYSPISLFVAAMSLFLWRPVMEELASALPMSGAPYTYILNISTKSIALLGAALLLLDFAATVVVSAATSTSYLACEVSLPFPIYAGAIIIFVLLISICLCGLRDSARVAATILAMHAAVMSMLIVASAIVWGRGGMAQLASNWTTGGAGLSSAAIARQVFNGVCIGMLGLTGFECAPAYTAKMKNCYPQVLRNLHLSTLFLNSGMMLLVLAILPLNLVESGENILSLLAQEVGGRWLRIIVVVDAVVILCAGVLTGILSACELIAKLSCDHIIPQRFLATLRATGAPYVAIFSFMGFSAMIYGSTGASLLVISRMFTMVWLAVMALFPMSLLFLRFSRPGLSRGPRCSLLFVVGAIGVAVTITIGDIAIDPTITAWFALYLIALLVLFSLSQNMVTMLRWIYWVYDQFPILHKLRFTSGWGDGLGRLMKSLRRQDICLLIKADELHQLWEMIDYTRRSEETSCIKIVHFHQGSIPSNMKDIWIALDNSVPDITIDLVLVEGKFIPVHLAAVSCYLNIPRSLMFMSSPGPNFEHPVRDLGTRIISI